jgi:hypothetical protein
LARSGSLLRATESEAAIDRDSGRREKREGFIWLELSVFFDYDCTGGDGDMLRIVGMTVFLKSEELCALRPSPKPILHKKSPARRNFSGTNAKTWRFRLSSSLPNLFIISA